MSRRRARRAAAVVFAAAACCGARNAFAEGSSSYEIREQLVGLLLPTREFDVTGSCSNGTGLVPSSLYASAPSGGGAGMGIGVGGRLAYHYATPLSGGTWLGLRVGGGLDLDLLYANVATGVDDTSGKLCARIKSDGVTVNYRGSAVLLGQLPLALGLELGLGQTKSTTPRGVVLGAAWAPTFSYLKPWVLDGELRASFLGGELSVDFAVAHHDLSKQTGTRVALFVLLPTQEHGPAMLTLSFGAFWY